MGKQNKKGITIDTAKESSNICLQPGNHLRAHLFVGHELALPQKDIGKNNL